MARRDYKAARESEVAKYKRYATEILKCAEVPGLDEVAKAELMKTHARALRAADAARLDPMAAYRIFSNIQA